jgi:DNA-binding XRE family transcriptional regulator
VSATAADSTEQFPARSSLIRTPGHGGSSTAVSPLERFGANLKVLRGERGWSQEDLSRHTGLHTTAISKIERGARAPRFPTVVILAQALRVPAGRLFDGIPDASQLGAMPEH